MAACGGVRGAGRLPILNCQGPRAKRSVDLLHFAVVGRVSACIRLSLRINISLTIGKFTKW